jgi:hypothetical protein
VTAATAETAPDVDAAAPFGRKADGTPKRGWGGRPTGKSPRTRRPVKTAPAPSRAKKPTAPRSKPTDYTAAAAGLVQLGAGFLSMVPSKPKPGKPNPWKLDALVLHIRAEELGAAVNRMAQTNTRLADALDRFNQASPWAEPVMLVVGIAAQFAVNHGIATPEKTSGFQTLAPEQLAAMAEGMAPPQPTAEPVPEPPEPPDDQLVPDAYGEAWPATNIADMPGVPVHA